MQRQVDRVSTTNMSSSPQIASVHYQVPHRPLQRNQEHINILLPIVRKSIKRRMLHDLGLMNTETPQAATIFVEPSTETLQAATISVEPSMCKNID